MARPRVTEAQRTILEILRDHDRPVQTGAITDEYYGIDSNNCRKISKILDRLRKKNLVYWKQIGRVSSDDPFSGWVLTVTGREVLE